MKASHDLMKFTLVFIGMLIGLTGFANMASPIIPGTLSATPFISKHVDIIKEVIRITPNEHFSTAHFHIEYHVNAQDSGNQIPLLFYAIDFRDDFAVSIDGVPVKLLSNPELFTKLSNTTRSDFNYLFSDSTADERLKIDLLDSRSRYVAIEDLKYFEINFSKGIHVIEVDYVANHWIDKGDWVKEYSFQYALSPAKFWLSFNQLEIILNNPTNGKNATTNLGPPLETTENFQRWTFDKIPVDVLIISYKPEPGKFAQWLISISPFKLAIIVFAFLMALHVILIRQFRKTHPIRKYSTVLFIGSILVPLVGIAIYAFGFSFISYLIGDDAGNNGAYAPITMGIYPFAMPIYFLVFWLIDRFFKTRFSKVS